MDTPEKTTKRLVVYDRKDPKKYYSLDISKAQVWELKPSDSDWDPFEGFFRQTTKRTLYRLDGKHWVLVEQESHVEAGLLGDPTCVALTDAEAAEQLVLSGHEPPADIAHHVADKLEPPPVHVAFAETPMSKVTGDLTKAETRREMVALGLLPRLREFGPMKDDYSGDETKLVHYTVSDRWILFTDPSHRASGKQRRSVTPAEATEWFLQNRLAVPEDLEEFLPSPDDQKPNHRTVPDGSLKAKSQKTNDFEGDSGAAPSIDNREGIGNPIDRKPPIVLGRYGEPTTVKGHPKELPSLPAYKLVKALVEAGDKGLSKGQLEPISTDYWRILKGLKDSDSDWKAVIHFPGKPHGRYRIV